MQFISTFADMYYYEEIGTHYEDRQIMKRFGTNVPPASGFENCGRYPLIIILLVFILIFGLKRVQNGAQMTFILSMKLIPW
jgi:hypothetical protein